jgi:N-[(2S)-2-amino-2-carboxyethyl]-L-glutamate dehydrogenase
VGTMPGPSLRIVKGREVDTLLTERTLDLVEVVCDAYLTHASGDSSLPHSSFVHVPGAEKQRVIALPGYVGGDGAVAGVKWIASFPDNLSRGLNRASAVIVLNSVTTGYPLALLEGAVISAKRTAASAALAARELVRSVAGGVALIGCGVINLEIVRFLSAVLPQCRSFRLFDTTPEHAEQFRARCQTVVPGARLDLAPSIEAALDGASIVSLATTAVTPHLDDLSRCAPGAVVLHVSLRDLTVDAILASDNVVDDADHVCRANTSVHLASLATGGRAFIRADLASVLKGTAPRKTSLSQVTVFSPFGLGVLDLAVARLVYDLAVRRNQGVTVDGFFADAWTRTPELAAGRA